MKFCLLFLFCFTFFNAFALIIPYSNEILKTPANNLKGFLRVDPEDKLPISDSTQCWIWHDNKNLIVYWEVDPGKNPIQGVQVADDYYAEADFLRIQLQTAPSDYYAYVFIIYPRGNNQDGIRDSYLGISYDWDSSVKTASTVTDSLWTAKAVIPFKDLRIIGHPPYNWRINVTRYYKTDNKMYTFPYTSINSGKVEYFKKFLPLIINDNIEKPRAYRLASYLVKGYDFYDKPETMNPDNIGCDFSMKPTGSTSFKVTWNPDFTDLPLDSENGNYNTKYAPYQSENRFFFTEDLDAFGVGNYFYTRSIVQPKYAIKFTGNNEKLTYGFFTAEDKKVTQDSQLLVPDDDYTMFSFKPKNEKSEMQISILDRRNGDYYNSVLYLNPVYKFDNDTELKMSILKSIKKVFEAPSESGYYLNSSFSKKMGDYKFYIQGSRCSPTLNMDMGYFNEYDYSAAYSEFSWNHNYPGENISNMSYSISSNYSRDFAWKKYKSKSFNGNIDINILENTGTGINANTSESWENDAYRKYDSVSWWLSNWGNNSFIFNLGARTGREYSYYDQNSNRYYGFNLGANGTIAPYVSYNFSMNKNISYNCAPIWWSDKNYLYANANLTLYLTKKLSVSNGMRHSNYTGWGRTPYLDLYSNFKYEYSANFKVYCGVQQKNTLNHYWHETEKLLYLKISAAV